MNSISPPEFALIGLFVIANCIIAAPLIKFYARALTIKQALIISAIAFGPISLALAAYFIAKSVFDLPREIDGPITLVAMLIAGTVTSAQAKRYGVRRTGWLGVGAKTAITLIVVTWLIFALNLATHLIGSA